MPDPTFEPLWKEWFAQHGPRLLLFARQQARNDYDAEDLLQEAFVRIWRIYGHTGEVAPRLVFKQFVALLLITHEGIFADSVVKKNPRI